MTAATAHWTTLLDVLFDDPTAGRCLVAPDGTVLRANAEWLRSTGYTAEQAIGADVVALFPETRDMALALHARARAGHTVHVPRHAQRLAGRETWWEGTIAPIPMEGGTGILITALEVSAAGPRPPPPEPAAAAAPGGAAHARALLGAIVEGSRARLAVVTGRELRFAHVSPAYQAIAPGRPMLGQTYGEVFPEAAAGSRERLLRVLETGEPWEVDRWRAPVPGKPDATWQGRVVRLPAGPGEPPSALVEIEEVAAGARADEALREEREKLRESEDRFRAVFESASDAVILSDPSGAGRIVMANPAACRLFGWTAEEFGSVERARMLDASDPNLAAFLAARARGERAGPTELTYLRKDGTRFTGEITAATFRDRADQVRSVAIVRDVTDRRRAEEAAREGEARYRTLFTNMTEGFALGEAICDEAGVPRDFRLLEMNEAFERQSGLARARAQGRPIREVLPRIEQSWIDTYCGVALGGEPRRFESYNRDLDRHFSVYCFSPARGRFAILFTDVTDRVRAEAAVRENEEKFRAVFERAAIGIGRVRFSDARWIDVNEAFCRMLGRPMDELLRTPWPEITHPDDLEADLVPFRRMAAGELEAYTVEKRFLHADGHHVWAKLTLSLVRGPDGRPDYEIAIIEDVGDRKRAERALRESQERLQEYADLVEHAPVLVRDARDRIVVWNRGMERMYGWTREAALGRSSHELLGTRFPVPLAAIEAALERTGAWEGELRHRRADGAELAVASRWLLHRDDAGARRAVVEVNSDVTGLRRAEAALREANERLREADRRKDEFLGMLSHELRNPLAPIRNALWLLDRAEPSGPQARRAKEVANRQVAHLTRLVDDLLDVTRIARGKIELRRGELDLADLARRTADDYRALMLERGLAVAVDARGPVLVDGDETRLAQVLGNLLSNAAKFTPAGGRVELAVSASEGAARVLVRDTGPGIAPDVLPTIFEPFTQGKQTLARSEGGLGLGLALVKALVELHGGAVTVSTGAGGGTTFALTLPLAGRGRGAGPSAAAARGPAEAPRRLVLVVDDNRDAADTLAQLVELLGHDALVAYDGPGALEAARARTPDVVLCDLGLPGMDGYEVARQLRAFAPAATRLVAVSGYAQPEDVARAAEAGFDAHVAKPADPGRLAAVLA